MTYSEFGRRIRSNAALGTDHGTAAPVFLFGSCIKNQILGDHPIIDTQVGIDEGVPMQYDFRDIYGTILKDWLGLDTSEVASVLHPNVQTLSLFKPGCIQTLSSQTNQVPDNEISLYPNPASSYINIEFSNWSDVTQVSILDAKGSLIENIQVENYSNQSINLNVSNYPTGTYFVHIQNKYGNKTKKFIKT
jgi:hypothetical protein